MHRLSELAEVYQTDKGPNAHNYTEAYGWVLPQPDCVKAVLELGVYGGPSLCMWRDYYPHAQIYGVEVDLQYSYHGERIETLIADQCDVPAIRAFVGSQRLDVILDDAGHDPPAQAASFLGLYDLLAPGGVYVIEDIVGDVVPSDPTYAAFRQWCIDQTPIFGCASVVRSVTWIPSRNSPNWAIAVRW